MHPHSCLFYVGPFLRDPNASGFSESLLYVPDRVKLTRANSSYMRAMTEQMIITHEQLTLLKNIGQGTRDMCIQILRQPSEVHQTNAWELSRGPHYTGMYYVMAYLLYAGEFGIVYKADLASKHTDAATNRIVAVKTLKGMD